VQCPMRRACARLRVASMNEATSMNPSELKDKLRGVMAFVPTPFTSDDRLDGDGLARQVDFLVRSGAHVVVVCGGVGEFYSLEPGEYRDCMRIAVDAAAGRVPV